MFSTREITHNQSGAAVYKQLMLVAVVLAIAALFLLLRRSVQIEETAPDIEDQAEQSGVDLEEFK